MFEQVTEQVQASIEARIKEAEKNSQKLEEKLLEAAKEKQELEEQNKRAQVSFDEQVPFLKILFKLVYHLFSLYSKKFCTS